MKRRTLLLVMASVFAAVGVSLAVRSHLVHSGASPIKPDSSIQAQGTRVDGEKLSALIDTEPSKETVSDILDLARERALIELDELPRSTGTLPRKGDLASAFRERLEYIINPDLDKEVVARTSRGAPEPTAQELEELLKRWDSAELLNQYAPLGPTSIECRMIYKNGKRLVPTPQQEGLASITVQRIEGKRFDIPADPVASRLDIVEVRVPMRLAATPAGTPLMREGRTDVTLVGFQFGWNAKREQWIPTDLVMYLQNGQSFFSPRY